MKILQQKIEVLTEPNIPLLEAAGRTCYRSESVGDPVTFLRKIITRGHEAVLEHTGISVSVLTSRDVSHELVRHRIASYCQESQRYVRYSELEVIEPHYGMPATWMTAMQDAEKHYLNMLREGMLPEDARTVMPNSVATRIIVTANCREWRHILKLRTAKGVYPPMKNLMLMILEQFQKYKPLFEGIN